MKRKTLNKLLVILLIGLIICGCNKAKRKIEGEKEFSQLVETIKENFKVILDKEKYIVRDSETPQGRIISSPFYEIVEKEPVKYKSKYFVKEEGAKVVITQQGEENFVLEYVPFFSDKESRVFIDIMIKYGFKPYVLNELIYDKSKGNDFSEIERILGRYDDKKIDVLIIDGWWCYPNYESAGIMFVLDECMIHDYKNGTAKFSYELGAEYRYLVTNNTEIGAGLSYQNHGKLKKFTDVEDNNLKVEVSDTKLYDSVPLYLTAKYNFRNDSDIVPYVKADLGYSFNINGKNSSQYKTYSKATGAVLDEGKLKDFKAENGVYYSVGAGVVYKGFTTGLSYQVNTAKIEGTRYDGLKDKGSANFRRFTLSFGYQFGL